MPDMFEIGLVLVIVAISALILMLLKPKQPQVPPEPVQPASGPAAEHSDKPTIHILFGSQSGTAESFAEEMRDEAKAYGMVAKVIDLEDYEPSDLAETKFCLLLMATFGEGEPTDNAVAFWEWINDEDNVTKGTMEKLTYAVFALGNRQWEHFCAVGKKLHNILEQGGGTPLLDCGVGDDDGSMENDFGEWKVNFWAAAKTHFGLEEDNTERPVEVPFNVNYVYHPNDTSAKSNSNAASEYEAQAQNTKSDVEGFLPDDKFKARLVTVSTNRELRSDTFEGNTRHIELELPSSLSYNTADNLGVFSHNDYKLSGKMVKRLGLHSKTILKLVPKQASYKTVFPKAVTALDAILWYCDFTSVPRATALKNMAYYCSDLKQKAQLKAFASDPEQKAACALDQKNWLEILEEFPALKLPVDVFLHMVPKLSSYPRYYTISSSSRVHPRQIHITVTVSDTKLPRDRVYKGICSTYLLHSNTEVKGSKPCLSVFVKPSTFRLPKPMKPVIMFGPGTGVAPFRAFWQEARWLKEQGTTVQDWHLFFGCRYENKDWLYKEEMQELKDLGIATHLAFSRDRKTKTYVQDLLKDEKLGSEMWNLIKNKGAFVYVCGASKMGRSVKESLCKVAVVHGGLSDAEADRFFKQMIDEKKTFIQELW